eukprot:COSAG05_NODE_1493_length_4715_cov_4.480069_1_plen_731_part_00
MLAKAALTAAFLPLCAGQYRHAADGEVTPVLTTYAIDGISGYTTYRLQAQLAGDTANIYTHAGSDSLPSHFPAAFQVAAPFGSNVGGVDPRYFEYNDQAEFDSYLTCGEEMNAGDISSIGIDFDTWDESGSLSFGGRDSPAGGAVFWMDPANASPTTQDGGLVDLAQLTITTDTMWNAQIGEIQGRSVEGLDDWHVSNVVYGNDGSMLPASGTCFLTQQTPDAMAQQQAMVASCCNGGSGSGHRRSLQTCLLTTCTAQCAALFVAAYADDACHDAMNTQFTTNTASHFNSVCLEASPEPAPENACDPWPCMNGGTCTTTPFIPAGYTCQCAGSYTGTNCESGDTVTVYIINAQDQCGESTIPSDWAQLGLDWISGQDLTATVGTCASMGYTVPAGSQVLQGTGAPTDPTVTIYTRTTGSSSNIGTPAPACVSAASCEDLDAAYGGSWGEFSRSPTVCGESDAGFATVSFGGIDIHSDGCYGGTGQGEETDGWQHAESICYEVGARLCTASELEAGVGMGTGCGHNSQRLWTSDTCTVSEQFGQTENGHVSLPAGASVPGEAECSLDDTNHGVRCCADADSITSTTQLQTCDGYAAEEELCTSALSCEQLHTAFGGSTWNNAATYGDVNICGESDIDPDGDGQTLCYGGSGSNHEVAPTWAVAQSYCSQIGARMCTVEELEADETRGSGCGFDANLVWSIDDIGCQSGSHVVVGGRSTANVDQVVAPLCHP